MRASVAVLLALASTLPTVAGCLDGEAGQGRAASDTVGGAHWHVRESDFYHSYRANAETFTDTFPWSNPEGRAQIEMRHDFASGTERVIVKDAKGSFVYSGSFSKSSQDGVFRTGNGAPGTWTIVLERQAVTGQFDVHAWRVLDAATTG